MSNNIWTFGAGCLWALICLEIFIWITSDVRLMFYYLPHSISLFLLLTLSIINSFTLGKFNAEKLAKSVISGCFLGGFFCLLLAINTINDAIYNGHLFDFVKKVFVYFIIPANATLVVSLLILRPKNTYSERQEKKNTRLPLVVAISSSLAGVIFYALNLSGKFSMYYTTSQFIISTLSIATPFVFMSFYFAEKIRTRRLQH